MNSSQKQSNAASSASQETPARGAQAARERLLDAAEWEFATHGYAAGSLRQITDRAGLSLGMVKHHFGSKHDLLRAVYNRLFEPLALERKASLERLNAQPDAPTAEQFFVAAFDPMLHFFNHPDGGRRAIISMRGLFEHDAFWPIVKEVSHAVGNAATNTAIQVLSEVTPEEAARRLDVATKIQAMYMMPTLQNVEFPQPPSRADVEAIAGYAFLVFADRHPTATLEFTAFESWGNWVKSRG